MLESIRLVNFRSYKDTTFHFSPNVTIIIGPNGAGKTNVLEAVLVACRGSSYRAADGELITHGQDWTRIETVFDGTKRQIKLLRKTEAATEKNFEIDSKKLQRLSVQTTLPVVLFEPDSLRLLSGSPSRRRDFLDAMLEGIHPGYRTLRNKYKRVLTQRNALLKQPHNDDQLFVWDIKLSELGGKVAEARQEIIGDINKMIGKIYSSIADVKTNISLHYSSTLDSKNYTSSLLTHLQKNTKRDNLLGFTTYGPHRDDIVITIDARSASSSASRGETRTLLLALKIIELQLLEKLHNARPLLLLDDVFSELDSSRQLALTKYIKKYQTIITSVDANEMEKVENFSLLKL